MNQLRRDLTTKNERYYRMNMLHMLNVEELKVMYLFENMSKRKRTFIFFCSLRK
jgi:hypothetical protein